MEQKLKGFLHLLEGYEMPQIIEAIVQYCSENSDIPAPADILKILNPPLPQLSGSYYQSLLKKRSDGTFLDLEEENFIFTFERIQKEMARKAMSIINNKWQR